MANHIASDVNIARVQATKLENAVQALEGNWPTETDHQTTLQGNQKAQTLSKQQKIWIQCFSTAFQADIANIHRAAQEFEAFDQKLQQDLKILLP